MKIERRIERRFKARNHKLASKLVHNCDGFITERIGVTFKVAFPTHDHWANVRTCLIRNPDYQAFDIDMD